MPSLLEALPEYVLYWLVKKGKERTLQEKEVLLTQGEKNDSLYIVLDGLIGVYAIATLAKHTEHVGPGSLLGETSFFTDGVESATAIAEEPSLVLELPKSDLKEKLEHDHAYAADFYKALLETVSHRLKQTSIKLYAAEGAAESDITRDPVVRKAQEEIDRFKKTTLDLDREAMKKGSISDQSLQLFLNQAKDLMHTCHTVLGPIPG
jgi:CRP-like cAMP-binding protein